MSLDIVHMAGTFSPIMHNETRSELVGEAPPIEVRRCAACGTAAMIPVQVWQHTGVFVRPGQRTFDCRCQQCGASVTLYDPIVIKHERQAALFLVWTIIVPLILLPSAARRQKAWEDHPVVRGAELPPIRYDRPESRRKCGKCGTQAELGHVEQHKTNGIPTGTERSYRCEKCGWTFTVENAAGKISNAIGALLFLGGGLIAMTEANSSPTEHYLLGPMAIAAGIWFVWSVVRSVIASRRNPST